MNLECNKVYRHKLTGERVLYLDDYGMWGVRTDYRFRFPDMTVRTILKGEAEGTYTYFYGVELAKKALGVVA